MITQIKKAKGETISIFDMTTNAAYRTEPSAPFNPLTLHQSQSRHTISNPIFGGGCVYFNPS